MINYDTVMIAGMVVMIIVYLLFNRFGTGKHGNYMG
jgi:hypothetical protein